MISSLYALKFELTFRTNNGRQINSSLQVHQIAVCGLIIGFMDSAETSTSSNYSMRPDNMRGGAFRNGNIDQLDDDSPYGQSSPSLMDPSVSPQNSILPSRGWDDISVYNAKKVTLVTALSHVFSPMHNETSRPKSSLLFHYIPTAKQQSFYFSCI